MKSHLDKSFNEDPNNIRALAWKQNIWKPNFFYKGLVTTAFHVHQNLVKTYPRLESLQIMWKRERDSPTCFVEMQ